MPGHPDGPAPRPDEPRARDVLAQARFWSLADEIVARQGRFPPVRTYALPLYVNVEVKLNIDPVAWNTGFLAVHEADLPPELFADLRELTPQALLRDLHRPVKEFFVTPEVIEGTDLSYFLVRALRAARRARTLEARPQVSSLTRKVRDEQLRRRAFLATKWEPWKSDDAPRDRARTV